MTIFERLYSALTAQEALSVVSKSESRLNARGERLLRMLRARRRRSA